MAAKDSTQKIHPALKTKGAELVPVIIEYADGVEPDKKMLKELGCTSRHKLKALHGISAECPADAIPQIADNYFVVYVWQDGLLELLLVQSVPLINADQAWSAFGDGTGINVSIIDSGINKTHPGLAGQVVLENDFSGEGMIDDVCNHGTPIASIIAGNDATYTGVAPGAKLFNAKVTIISDDGSGSCLVPMSNVIAAMDWSIEHGAQVLQMSFGAGMPCYIDPLSIAINKTAQNIPIIIGSGNSGPGNQSIYNPGCVENVITVGASDGNSIAGFSSWGPTDYGLMKPDLVAPGVGIISADSSGAGYSSHTGTSFSGPFVAGVAALMLEHFKLRSSEVKQILRTTAVDLGYEEHIQGAGRVDALAAVNLTLQQTPTFVLNVSELYLDSTVVVSPFRINATIRNEGNSPANNVVAAIVVPPEIEIISDETIIIGSLNGLDETKVSWLINPLSGGNYLVSVVANSSNAESSQDSLEVVFEDPKLAVSTEVPAENSVSKPIVINAFVTNSGGVDAQNVNSVLEVSSKLSILDGATRNIGSLGVGVSELVSWTVSASKKGTYSASITTTGSNAETNMTFFEISVNSRR